MCYRLESKSASPALLLPQQEGFVPWPRHPPSVVNWQVICPSGSWDLTGFVSSFVMHLGFELNKQEATVLTFMKWLFEGWMILKSGEVQGKTVSFR